MSGILARAEGAFSVQAALMPPAALYLGSMVPQVPLRVGLDAASASAALAYFAVRRVRPDVYDMQGVDVMACAASGLAFCYMSGQMDMMQVAAAVGLVAAGEYVYERFIFPRMLAMSVRAEVGGVRNRNLA